MNLCGNKIGTVSYFELNNGIPIPSIGIGTGIIYLSGIRSILADLVKRQGVQIKNAIKLKKVISSSLKAKCSMFDTSRAYGMSEKMLRFALKEKNREELFIITKLMNCDQKKDNIRNALFTSMKQLGVEYVDIYLIHWPQTDTYIDCWLEMEELYKEGLIRAIGVSNFHQHHLDNLLSVATVVPAVNEFERHPLLNQKPLIKYCEDLGIKVIAYTPIGRMHEKLKNNNILIKLAKKYSKTIAQIILRWDFQQGIITIPHTLKTERIKEYMAIFDFNLTNVELNEIDSINENLRLRYDPDNCDFSKL